MYFLMFYQLSVISLAIKSRLDMPVRCKGKGLMLIQYATTACHAAVATHPGAYCNETNNDRRLIQQHEARMHCRRSNEDHVMASHLSC